MTRNIRGRDDRLTSELEADFLLMAYAHGYFPMADPRSGKISWYSPDPRAIIPFTTYRPPRSLRRVVEKHVFDVRFDTAFQQVIRGCSHRHDTWISDEFVRAYVDLHALGHAHSVETWKDEVLAGGLYGVTLGGAFFGESMFSLVPNASKVAFVHLVERLRSNGFVLLDTQFLNDHVMQFGAYEISRQEYLVLLGNATRTQAKFTL